MLGSLVILRERRLQFVKKVYVSETEGLSMKGRPAVRWKDRMKEYMYERVADRGTGIEQASVWIGRWRFFCCGQTRHQKL